MTDATSETIQNHLSDTKKRKRSGWRLFWMLLAAFGLLIIGLPIVVYVSWQAHGRRLLRDELAAIKAKGEPITTAELNAWYAVPTGERDITAIWQAAIAPFETPQHDQAAKNVPIVGGGTIPPLDQPWPDEAVVKTYLDTYQSQLAALHAAAKEKGSVRFPHDFTQGIAMLLPEAQQTRSAARALRLQMHQNIRDKNVAAALDNLDTRVALANTLEHDPLLIVFLVRIAVHGLTFEDIRLLQKTLPLTDDQLARLQDLVRRIQLKQQFADCMLGERAMTYHAFHSVPGVLSGGASSANGAMETTEDISRIGRPEDCAMALSMLARMREAHQQAPAEAIKSAEAIEQDLSEIAKPITGLRYVMTMTLVPALHVVSQANARHVAQRDMTDCLLALRRYELKQGKLPATLAELVPDYLPAIPLDPYDGQSLRYFTTPESTVIYSVGEDRVDNGGQTDQNNLKPDMTLIYKASAQ